jgi:hypothetical protein
MSELVNILDSEIKELQGVHQTLEGRTYKSHNLAAFEREIVERFQEIGFVVDVKWYQTNIASVSSPVVEVIGRCTPVAPEDFDHEKMAHEVVSNVLGLPEEDAGIIKTPETWTEAQAKAIHKQHGPGCDN